MSGIIQTKRLDLIPLSPAVLRAALELDRNKIGRLLGASVPQSWEIRRGALELWLRQLEANPALQPWLARGMVLRSEGQLIGGIGCHSDPFSAPASGLKTVELGYNVVEAWRRRGFAQEAIEALIQWASTQHRVPRFVLSISPENQPSRALAAKMGFQKVGFKIDEQDGHEDIFEKIV